MKNYLLFIFCSLNIVVYAQQWDWASKSAKTTGEQVSKKVCTDTYGNVYVLGVNYYGKAVLDSGNFVVKYDPAGTLQWTHHITGEVTDIASDGYGNIYVLGYLDSIGKTNVHIIKYNSSGYILWEKYFGGNSFVYGGAFAVTRSGTIYVTGEFESDSLSFDNHIVVDTTSSPQIQVYSHFFLAKINSSGMTNWISRGPSDSTMGYYWGGGLLRLDKKENIYIVARGSVDICYGCYGEFLAKYDTLGNLRLSKYAWDMYASVEGLAIDDSMNIFAIYNNTGTHYYYTAGLAKYDSLMNFKWLKQLDYGPGPLSMGVGLSIDSSNNLYFAGSIGEYPNLDSVFFANQWVHVAGLMDIIVSKLDPAGNYIWIKTAGGKNAELPTDMCVNRSGVCYITGYFNYTWFGVHGDAMKFDNNTLKNDGDWRQLFVAQLDSGKAISGVQSLSEIINDINIFPNPSSGKFYIQTNISWRNTEICIFDLSGRCVYHQEVTRPEDYQIDLSKQSKGVYFIEVADAEKRVVKKIVIQ